VMLADTFIFAAVIEAYAGKLRLAVLTSIADMAMVLSNNWLIIFFKLFTL
jgi:hypothetical protein